MCFLRLLELTFFLYFAIHIPVAILFDSQVLYPKEWYPTELLNVTEWYVKELKDPYMLNSPIWYKSFVAMEQTVQLPFFFVAAVAFLKGGCQWIRIPTLIYASHVATTLLPMLASFALDDFTGVTGPSTVDERMKLIAIYSPFFVVPLLQILTMSFSATYQGKSQQQPAGKSSPKKKHHKTH